MNIIEINDLKKKYGKKEILNGVNLAVEKGKVVGIIGGNGEGKTTLFNCISGAINNYTGDIKIKGKIGYQPQDSNYDTNSKVQDEINLLKIIENQTKKTQAENLYYANKKITSLSNGMKRKFDVLQALIGNPDILLLDEPTSGLDISVTKEIKKLLLKQDKTIILSSHIITDYEELCDEIYVLKNGKLTKLDKNTVQDAYALKLNEKITIQKLKKLLPAKIHIKTINQTTFKLEKTHAKDISKIIENLEKENLFKSINVWSDLYE